MKIFYLANSYIPSRSANSIHVMKMCQALAQNRHDVTLLTFDSTLNEEQDVDDVFMYYGVEPCFRIKKLPLRNIKGKIHLFSLEAINYIKSRKCDLVYTRCSLPAIYLSYTSIPYVFEIHKPPSSISRLQRPFFRHIFKAANLKRFIVISSALKTIFTTEMRLNGIDVAVLHDGADLLQQENNIPAINWNCRNGHMQAGYFGHLYPGRGIEVLLHLAGSLPSVDFHIVGGKEKDVTYWQHEAGHLKNLYFHGFISPRDVAYYRQQCDILLAPYQKQVWVENRGQESSRYMSPLKIFEYMSSRKCIICSDIPVLREVLNENNAILVSPDDTSEWIDAVSRCSDKNIRKRLAEQAFSDFLNNFTWSKRAENALSAIGR